jgi:uncharacterized OsmC-like protein
MSEVVSQFTISMEQVHDYEFVVRFDHPETSLVADERPPLGADAGPSPSRLLAAAVGNCLAASLLFCARKARLAIGPIRCEVKVRTARNENKRLRIESIEVALDPGIAEGDAATAARCLSIFEDYCTVSQSVRAGINLIVRVKGFEGM